MMIRTLPLAALPLLAACATLGNAPPPLVPSQWEFVSIDGKAPISRKARLTIEPGRIGANVGCNGMGGTLQVEPERLITGAMMATMMYCEGLMEQEDAVSGLLGGSPQYRYEGDRLTLTAGLHNAELKRIP